MTTTYSDMRADIKAVEDHLGITITGYEHFAKYEEISNKVIYLISDSFADKKFDINQLDELREKYWSNYQILFMYACKE